MEFWWAFGLNFSSYGGRWWVRWREYGGIWFLEANKRVWGPAFVILALKKLLKQATMRVLMFHLTGSEVLFFVPLANGKGLQTFFLWILAKGEEISSSVKARWWRAFVLGDPSWGESLFSARQF
ncbi:hypothetical protein ACH5RR_012563 [Cinchona calisaya]|uniref:Uncharacterized protein n=1 Tax=Cinchona calisaya TaxID=153742 RepID=A0ABD3A861_9GENT